MKLLHCFDRHETVILISVSQVNSQIWIQMNFYPNPSALRRRKLFSYPLLSKKGLARNPLFEGISLHCATGLLIIRVLMSVVLYTLMTKNDEDEIARNDSKARN